MSNGIDPAAIARNHARDADRALDQAEREAAFADEVDAVSKRATGLAALVDQVSRARARGWRWGPEWEPSVQALRESAPAAARDVRQEASSASGRLRPRIASCRTKLSSTSPTAGNAPTLHRLEDEAEAIKAAVTADAQRISAIARPFVESYDRLEGDVKKAHLHLDRFEAAKFALAPGEHPWMTAEATWQDAPGGAVSGFLYLTDQRLRFEQKETVATKKFLFVTTASEERHATLIDEPIGHVAKSDDATKGLVFKDQLLTIGWTGTKHKSTRFDINSGDTAELWDGCVEDARAGRLAYRMSSVGGGPATLGVPIDPPTVCSACSAALDAPVRGNPTLVCKYCGQRHDLRFA